MNRNLKEGGIQQKRCGRPPEVTFANQDIVLTEVFNDPIISV